MPSEIFPFMGDHAVWSDPDDSLFANLSRTLRIGRHPTNVATRKCKGLQWLEEWEGPADR